jgi:hypothetical protein
MCYLPKDQRWQDGVTQALSEKLGIHESMQREGLHISEAPPLPHTIQRNTEECRAIHGLSMGYPCWKNHFTTKLCTKKSLQVFVSTDL